MSRTALSTGDTTVSWDLDVTDSTLLLGVAYVFPSVLGGIILLVVGLVAWLVASAVLVGDFDRAVGVLVVVFLALLSRRYLLALLSTDLIDPFFERYSRRGLVVGSLLGALVILGSTRLHPDAPFALFIASWVPLVLTAAFPTRGHVDRASRTLVVDGTDVPLEAISRVQTGSLGAVTVCWLSYVRGNSTAPRTVVVPTEHTETISTLIDTPSSASTRNRSTIDRSERLIAGLFGLGLLAVGPVLWLVLPSGDARIVALYAGAMFGLFGLFLCWYAFNA